MMVFCSDFTDFQILLFYAFSVIAFSLDPYFERRDIEETVFPLVVLCLGPYQRTVIALDRNFKERKFFQETFRRVYGHHHVRDGAYQVHVRNLSDHHCEVLGAAVYRLVPGYRLAVRSRSRNGIVS